MAHPIEFTKSEFKHNRINKQVAMATSIPPQEPVEKPKFNPTTVLEISNPDPLYAKFISEYWTTNLDELQAIAKAGVSYSKLQEWKLLPEFKNHVKILMDYRVDRLAANYFIVGDSGDNRASEFILANLSDTYRKKKPKEDKGPRKTMSSVVTQLMKNGDLDEDKE